MNTYAMFAEKGMERLQEWFHPETGLWESTGWWNAANILWVILDYAGRSKNNRYAGVVAKHVFEKHEQGGFLNEYYDDEGWWALTWIKAYDVLGEERYLAMARRIFEDMCTGWDKECGGGIWWKKERKYKNAIANELFIAAGTKLCLRSEGRARTEYFNWAVVHGWQWFEQSGMMNRDFLINDGLNEQCQNNGGVTWSYNQGVILAGLADMSIATGFPEYIRTAKKIANAAITALSDKDGILHEPCEPNCGEDGPQFKGIFVRNLAYLYTVDKRKEQGYHQFILRNADSIIENDQVDYRFGLNWAGLADSADAARQSSALDAIIVAMSLAKVAHT